MFDCLEADRGEGNRPVVCRVTIVSFFLFEYWGFHSCGMVPCSRPGAISSAHSFNKRAGMVSGP